MLLSNGAICAKKKSIFIKNKELNNVSNDSFKMNKIINKFLLTGDKFMSELKQQVLLIVIVDHLLNIVKEFKNLEKQVI